MIVAEDLTKSFRSKPVLRGVSFTASKGEITLLVGPNGAGKSTTMKLLTGVARADRGRALIDGTEITSHTVAAQRKLSFLPQNPNFHPRFTCEQILGFYAALRGIDHSAVRAMLARVGLGHVARDQTRTLSGGMRQRLGLAVLLLPNAPVLLLDEPGLSLDPAWRRTLQEMLQEEARIGKTVLVTTHLISEWNHVADRCLLCRNGVIERDLDPTNLPVDFEAFADAEGMEPVKDPE